MTFVSRSLEKVELDLFAEVIPGNGVDVVPSEAKRDDDRQREPFVLDRAEHRAAVQDRVPVCQELPCGGNREVRREEAPHVVVADGEGVGLVLQLNGEGVGHLAGVNLNVLDFASRRSLLLDCAKVNGFRAI